MRPFELALLAAVLVGCVRPLSRSAHRIAVAVVVAVGILSVGGIHLAVEGPRWQLTPIYVVAIVAAACSAVATAQHAGGTAPGVRSGARLRWAGIAVVAVLGGLLGWALPVPVMPEPAGEHAVGTIVVALTDHDRVDRYGDGPTGPRRLVAQLWYPAAPDAPVELAAWVPTGHRFGRVAANWLSLPPFALDHVALIRSRATLDVAPLPHGDLPVVVYAHGWGGFRGIQAGLAASLASRGYVVAALDHTHASVATQFPDGEVVPIDPAALPSAASQEVYDAAATRLVATFSDDLGFLLDQLADPTLTPFGDRLELDRVGFIGHSTGGGAAIDRCADDPRCAAVVGFDPWVEPVSDAIVGDGLEVPLLSLRSEEWLVHANDARLRRLHAASTSAAGLVAVAGTTHRDVTLLAHLSPLTPTLGIAGTTPGARTHEIVEVWTARFLDAHLRGRVLDDPLLTPPSFEEATVDG